MIFLKNVVPLTIIPQSRNAVDNFDADQQMFKLGTIKAKMVINTLEDIDVPLGTVFLCAGCIHLGPAETKKKKSVL